MMAGPLVTSAPPGPLTLTLSDFISSAKVIRMVDGAAWTTESAAGTELLKAAWAEAPLVPSPARAATTPSTTQTRAITTRRRIQHTPQSAIEDTDVSRRSRQAGA